MKEFDVSFEIKTEISNLEELTKIIGISPSNNSHEKGQPRGKKTWTETYWKLFSSTTPESNIEEHLEDIFSQMAVSDVLLDPEKRKNLFPSDCSFYLSIAVFYDDESWMETIEIPFKYIEKMNIYKLDLEICLYKSESAT